MPNPSQPTLSPRTLRPKLQRHRPTTINRTNNTRPNRTRIRQKRLIRITSNHTRRKLRTITINTIPTTNTVPSNRTLITQTPNINRTISNQPLDRTRRPTTQITRLRRQTQHPMITNLRLRQHQRIQRSIVINPISRFTNNHMTIQRIPRSITSHIQNTINI